MNLGITKEEAERLIRLYFDQFPMIEQYVNDTHKVAIANQCVITPFGQTKHEFGTLECFKGTAVYNAALRNSQNVLIQSTTSTLGLLTFATLNQEMKKLGCKAICTVYDSCEFEVPVDKVAEAFELCYYYMNDWPKSYFPWLGIDIGVEGGVSSIGWGGETAFHRGTTQEEFVEFFKKEGRYEFSDEGIYLGPKLR